MIIFPAIDILDNQAVRLRMGDPSHRTVYGDPRIIASNFNKQGCTRLHIVDLNAAFNQHFGNREIIQETISVFDGFVQIGGGVRSLEDVTERIETYGAANVIIGTAALNELSFLKAIIQRFPNQVICSLDAKNGNVAVNGWSQYSQVSAVELAVKLADIGFRTIVYTDIDKDGMMEGPNIERTAEMILKTHLQVIASGGVSSIGSLSCLIEIGCYGAIIGKAIYERALLIEDVKNINGVEL